MAFVSKEIMLQIKTTIKTQPLFSAQMTFTEWTFVMIVTNPAKAHMALHSLQKMLLFKTDMVMFVVIQLNKRIFN